MEESVYEEKVQQTHFEWFFFDINEINLDGGCEVRLSLNASMCLESAATRWVAQSSRCAGQGGRKFDLWSYGMQIIENYLIDHYLSPT